MGNCLSSGNNTNQQQNGQFPNTESPVPQTVNNETPLRKASVNQVHVDVRPDIRPLPVPPPSRPSKYSYLMCMVLVHAGLIVFI